jgi:hypothetical protein
MRQVSDGAIVDYDAFDDMSHEDAGHDPSDYEGGQAQQAPRMGDRVFHRRYGRGVVERVELGEPVKITARFPGFGSRKVLAQYLRFA